MHDMGERNVVRGIGDGQMKRRIVFGYVPVLRISGGNFKRFECGGDPLQVSGGGALSGVGC